MAYYMIHTYPSRFWYVRDFLLPSMLKQGIPQEKILVYNDKNCIGNLRAWVDSCNRLAEKSRYIKIKNVWHLQDDVVISKKFKQYTEEYENHPIVCGFTCGYDKEPEAGKFLLEEKKMWYSFPCINISTELTTDFARWANANLWQSKHFREAVRRNNCDDLIFREWLYDCRKDVEEINLNPNIVNHVDKMIGGSICNKQRDPDKDTMSIFWDEDDVVENLRKALSTYKGKNKMG